MLIYKILKNAALKVFFNITFKVPVEVNISTSSLLIKIPAASSACVACRQPARHARHPQNLPEYFSPRACEEIRCNDFRVTQVFGFYYIRPGCGNDFRSIKLSVQQCSPAQVISD